MGSLCTERGLELKFTLRHFRAFEKIGMSTNMVCVIHIIYARWVLISIQWVVVDHHIIIGAAHSHANANAPSNLLRVYFFPRNNQPWLTAKLRPSSTLERSLGLSDRPLRDPRLVNALAIVCARENNQSFHLDVAR